MALQRINWTQIDSSNVPSGSTVYLGSIPTPLDGVYTDVLFIADQEGVLHDFFYYLSGYTPYTGSTWGFATTGSNIFHGTEVIYGPLSVYTNSGNSITTNGPIFVSGSSGSTSLGEGYIILSGNPANGIPEILLYSSDPINKSTLFFSLSGINNVVNPWPGPTITQINSDGNLESVIGFQKLYWMDRWKSNIFYSNSYGIRIDS